MPPRYRAKAASDNVMVHRSSKSSGCGSYGMTLARKYEVYDVQSAKRRANSSSRHMEEEQTIDLEKPQRKDTRISQLLDSSE